MKGIRTRLYYLTELKQRFFGGFFQKEALAQENILKGILKKYSAHFFILFGLVSLSFLSEMLSLVSKEKPKPLSLDSLVPENFVLVPIELSNGMDIVNIIGSYGVVDLYAYSNQTRIPENQVAKAIKILPSGYR